jgi:hypothetical protein
LSKGVDWAGRGPFLIGEPEKDILGGLTSIAIEFFIKKK